MKSMQPWQRNMNIDRYTIKEVLEMLLDGAQMALYVDIFFVLTIIGSMIFILLRLRKIEKDLDLIGRALSTALKSKPKSEE